MSSPFDPPSPERAAQIERRLVVSSVQTSLYNLLRRRYPTGSGKVAWYLIWLSMPGHKNQGMAECALNERPVSDLQQLVDAVVKCKESSKATPAWRELCDQILVALRRVAPPAPAASPAPPSPADDHEGDMRRGAIVDALLASGASLDMIDAALVAAGLRSPEEAAERAAERAAEAAT